MASTLRFGARGEWPEYLQKALASLGFEPGSPDGVFGQRTLDAVRAFQMRATPGAVDGVVGPKTWAALDRWLEGSSSGTGESVVADDSASKSVLTAEEFPALYELLQFGSPEAFLASVGITPDLFEQPPSWVDESEENYDDGGWT